MKKHISSHYSGFPSNREVLESSTKREAFLHQPQIARAYCSNVLVFVKIVLLSKFFFITKRVKQCHMHAGTKLPSFTILFIYSSSHAKIVFLKPSRPFPLQCLYLSLEGIFCEFTCVLFMPYEHGKMGDALPNQPFRNF